MKKKNHLQTITGERKDLIGYFTVFPLHNCSSDDPLTAKIENIDSRNKLTVSNRFSKCAFIQFPKYSSITH